MNMNNDLVSIITPSYNTANFISETIVSVLKQTYTNWEMIIIDDCSDDNTEIVVTPFLVDSRIKFYRNKRNRGAAICRNIALKMAKGNWVAFLDSDDLWDSNKLEKQIRFMKKNHCHFSCTKYMEIDEKGKSLGISWTAPRKIGKIRMKMFNYMGCLTVMYDRKYVGLIQVADIKKRNDYALWLKVVKKCSAYYLDENLASYRIRQSGSIMNRKKNPMSRIKYNYALWRESEKKSIFSSMFLTGVNVIFGFLKKINYKKKEK